MRPNLVWRPTPRTTPRPSDGAGHTPPAAAPGGRRFRPEVQGLRALAVLLVLVYHLDPRLLPGGYVGVDVFFVISGFLITSLLYREATGKGRVALGRFYVRRVRRLLPAATVVLVATGAASLVLLPLPRLADTAWQLVASAAYVENLYLADQAVDYLSAEAPPSPVQHFWSLSVEEQFYVVWPLLFAVWALARRRPRAGTGFLVVVLGALFTASLAASVLLAVEGTAAAYFLPTTRAWELAAGGLLAVGLARGGPPSWLKLPLGWLGLAAIAASAVFYDAGTAFPGWAAALPVLGAVAVIAAEDSPGRPAASALLSTAPARFVGDVSYSLYLWHWPLIILTLAVTGRERLGVLDVVLVAALSLLLAWGTKAWVEDPVRDRGLVPDGRRALVVALAGVLVVSAVAAAGLVRVERSGSVVFDPAVHTGPAAIDRPVPSSGELMYPTPLDAAEDLPAVYDDGCQASQDDTTPDTSCVYGVEDADRTVAVVGDSHGAQWIPALEELALERGWRLVVFTKSACAFTDTLTTRGEARPYEECRTWNRAVVDELIDLRPDMAITSSSVMADPADAVSSGDAQNMMAEGMSRLWDRVGAAGVDVVMIRDTPRTREDVLECLTANTDDLSRCDRSEEEALELDDPQERAVRMIDGHADLIDLSDRFCVAGTCPAVVGNVVVYRDSHHMTGTYSRMLSADLGERLDAVLD
ncbi:acyltransferase [Nocardiopsis sp. EMB25]|uniref:acyltransferase family protein n=1 Tax=Nocardiopsis sp. EMB25 TaxID=2835867 RepID=UPI002283DB68|nr:acyltransferase family protein [Nocardiopsis sp. EMB25]MCY9782518.1 acyltransferase [Nocardiopsis sp. EMB25]